MHEDQIMLDASRDVEVPAQIRMHIAALELQTWKNTAYEFRLRYRVARGLEAASETDLQALQRQHAQALKAIDILQAMIVLIQAELPT